MKYLLVIFYINIAFAQTPWNDGSWQIWQKDSFMVAPGASGSLFHAVPGKHGTYNSNPPDNTLEPQLYTTSSSNVFVNSGNLHLLQEDNSYNVDGINRDFHYTSE